jgi:hypothetical protein
MTTPSPPADISAFHNPRHKTRGRSGIEVPAHPSSMVFTAAGAASRIPVRWLAFAGVIMTAISAGVSLAPPAVADPVADLKEALASARAATSCPPYRFDPVVEQVAQMVTKVTDEWLDHATTQVPVDDPLPGLKVLGYGGSKAVALQGAGLKEPDAIKGAMLEGFDLIADCSYTDFGVSLRQNVRSGYYLAVAVVAGA